jgi:UDP-N-acetylmuramoylalanine--D-glutamate ligase
VANGALGVRHDGAFLPIIDLQQIPLRGQHNHANVAAALAAVYAVLGDELPAHVPALARAISSFESLPHRLENVGIVNGVTCINDSQATIPEAAIRAMHAFEQPVTLIAGGRAKLENADAFDELGRAIAARAHLLVTIGEAAVRIEDAARRAGCAPEKIISAGDLTTAVGAATMGTPSGGTVVLSPSCASFDQFSSFEARGEAFRRAVADLIQGKTIEKPVEKSSQTL